MINIKPLTGYVLAESPSQEEQTKSGIYIDSSEKERPQEGTVVAIASQDSPVRVGDIVIYKKWANEEYEVDEIKYQFIKFEDLLGVKTK